jgi:hypothetical protein
MITLMKYFILLAIFFLLINIESIAQKPVLKHHSISYRSILQAGILKGQSANAGLQIQTVNGLHFSSWFAGIGLGIDYYGGKRSLPLFAAIEKEMRKNRSTPFLYGNAGYNFSWLKNKEKINSFGNQYSAKGGLLYEFGLGYKFLLRNKMYAGMTAGYSYKRQVEKYVGPQICNFCFPLPIPPVEEYAYTFRRVSIKFSWWF